MPVVVPCLASTGTPKGVSWREVFSSTMAGMLSSSSRSPMIGMQMRPRACVAMKLMAAGVTFSAAITRSPSFSRWASSVTMTNLVYMNWRRNDHTPSITRLAWPAYCLRMPTIATRYEQPSGGR